jgi:hypothetical protein
LVLPDGMAFNTSCTLWYFDELSFETVYSKDCADEQNEKHEANKHSKILINIFVAHSKYKKVYNHFNSNRKLFIRF